MRIGILIAPAIQGCVVVRGSIDFGAFGKVTKGYAVIEKIGKVKTNPGNNMPLKPVIIKKITVE